MNKFFSIIFMTGFAFLWSCGTDTTTNNTNPSTANSVNNLNTFVAGTVDTILYYSLVNNQKVDMTKANTTEWDVCFSRTKIYFNCGFRGPGKGGAFILKNTGFSAYLEAPETGYNTEISATVAALTHKSDSSWYHYDFAKSDISPIPGHLIILKTADGKYAKLQILSYYKGYPDSIPSDPLLRIDKTYSFKFAVQKDGTRKF